MTSVPVSPYPKDCGLYQGYGTYRSAGYCALLPWIVQGLADITNPVDLDSRSEVTTHY